VAERKKAHIDADMRQPVKEEDHPEEKQQVVVSRHHMFRAQVYEGQQVDPRYFLDIAFVALRDRMGQGFGGAE